VRAKLEHVLVPPASVGAELVKSDRGGDVTYHGPGQLVGYPIVNIEMGPSAIPCYVHQLEQVIIDSLADLGLPGASRLDGYPGVWIGDRKICAIGVKVSRGRTMHGFALNVDPDMAMFGHIVPCGITDKAVTSLAAEGVDVTMQAAVNAVAARFATSFGWTGEDDVERQDVAWRVRTEDLAPFTRGEGAGEPVRLLGRLAQAGVDSSTAVSIADRKPDWLRAKTNLGPEYRALKKTMRSLDLVTVCEEAGCPNIFECWKDGTATFMILGERCTRACGFCLVDTRHPLAVEIDEPERVAEAVARMGLAHAVITMVARDDLDDGGASIVAETIAAVRRRVAGCAVEVLISDMKGEPNSLDAVFASRPDVLNHNLETVARLQRAVRPSASYARSLAVLARAKAAGLVTKSGLIVGMGETDDEVGGALADLAALGVDIVTIGQYLRPTSSHLPVDRWVEPSEFARWAEIGEALGIGHVEASPLTRSSYHARQAAASVASTATLAAPSPSSR
jgi:lipoic acid synthetase